MRSCADIEFTDKELLLESVKSRDNKANSEVALHFMYTHFFGSKWSDMESSFSWARRRSIEADPLFDSLCWPDRVNIFVLGAVFSFLVVFFVFKKPREALKTIFFEDRTHLVFGPQYFDGRSQQVIIQIANKCLLEEYLYWLGAAVVLMNSNEKYQSKTAWHHSYQLTFETRAKILLHNHKSRVLHRTHVIAASRHTQTAFPLV